MGTSSISFGSQADDLLYFAQFPHNKVEIEISPFLPLLFEFLFKVGQMGLDRQIELFVIIVAIKEKTLIIVNFKDLVFS